MSSVFRVLSIVIVIDLHKPVRIPFSELSVPRVVQIGCFCVSHYINWPKLEGFFFMHSDFVGSVVYSAFF